MWSSNIEVEYRIRKLEEQYSFQAVEFEGAWLYSTRHDEPFSSKFLLALAEMLIKAGCAIKTSQLKTTKQSMYSYR